VLFTKPRQHEDAAHGGNEGGQRGEGYLSADWAVLLMKDNDKPGFIVCSCSHLTAYDDYLQKENHEIICLVVGFFFFSSMFSSREEAKDSHTGCLQPSLYTQLPESLSLYVHTHTHTHTFSTSVLT